MSEKKILGIIKTTDGSGYIFQSWDYVLHLVGNKEYEVYLELSASIGEEDAFRKLFRSGLVKTLGYPTEDPSFFGKLPMEYDLD